MKNAIKKRNELLSTLKELNISYYKSSDGFSYTFENPSSFSKSTKTTTYSFVFDKSGNVDFKEII